jgi:1-acyl-sn-glycerol-3-phosphate acyltransferase
MYYVPKMSYYSKHPEKYSEEECYRMAQIMIRHVGKRGRISTVATGAENLPEEGGYIMFSNHQGKWDALGIFSVHEKPATFVMDDKRSKMFITKQFCQVLHASTLERDNLKQQVRVINEVAAEIKSGRRYLLFPEGGYDHNYNTLSEFMPGSFKIAKKAQCPIVPVAIYDSYKAFEGKSFRPLITQVAFLEPIPYEDIKNLNTHQIRDLVVEQIQQKLDSMESLNDW